MRTPGNTVKGPDTNCLNWNAITTSTVEKGSLRQKRHSADVTELGQNLMRLESTHSNE